MLYHCIQWLTNQRDEVLLTHTYPDVKRVSITIADELLAAVDARAAALDRSRSWVIANSLREVHSRKSPPESGGRQDRAPKKLIPSVGLGESRLSQLKADLALTPEQRVMEAERTLMRSTRSERPRLNRVVSFERYEDFLEWDRGERICRRLRDSGEFKSG